IFYALIDLVSELEEEIKNEYGDFTYFEVLTLVANIYFANKNLDLVVLEAGVGGRCDATKVLGQSILSVITSLSIDHISALGNTIESIAWHKAGIMKDKTCSITLNKGLAHDVISEEASKLNEFKLYDYKDFILPNNIPVKGEFKVTFENKSVRINPKQFGLIRGENFPLAYAAIIKILEYFSIDVDANLEKIANSLSNSQWKGRMQVIGTDPLIILDGAHNVDAIEKLFKSIESVDHKRLITIIAIMDRKNHEDMTKFMRSKSDLLIVTSNGDSNSTSIDILSREANADQAFEDVDHALAYAKKIANPDDLILIAGSLYLVGEVLKLI
ncbi:MAG: bifunctional folylpolyglutamate synthase/dihydrofolate synthase, partial [Ezakiella massiliensis]